MTGRYAFLALGIAGLSMAGIFYSLAHAPVVTMVAYRMVFAALLMMPVALVARGSGAAQTRAPFTRADVWTTAGAGALFAFDLIIWAHEPQVHLGRQRGAVREHASDLRRVARLADLPRAAHAADLGRYRHRRLGIAIVARHDVQLSGRALIGDGLALLAALAETGYLLCGRSVRQRIDAPRYALGVYASCAAFVCVAAFGTGAGFAISGHDLMLAIGLAVVATVLGHTLVSQSLGYMPAAVVAVSFLAQPLLAAVFALIFLGQVIPLTTALGGLVALAGIGVVAYANERRPAEPLEM